MNEQQLKYFVFASIVSADNDEYTEDVKQEIMNRFGVDKDSGKEWDNYNWEYILEPIGNKNEIQRIIEIIKED